MPARRVPSSRRDPKTEAQAKKVPASLRGTLERLDDRLAPAVFTPTQDPGPFGANNGPAVAELQGFFAQAAANNESDTINLVPFRTYILSAAATEPLVTDGTNAFPSIVADGPGRNGITLNGNGATFARATGAGAPNFRFFRVAGTPSDTFLTVNDLTLTSGNVGVFNGGALLATGGAALTVNNSTIISNSAASGGGVYVANGSGVILNNVTLGGATGGNIASVDGGAINNAGTGFVQVNNSRILGNSSTLGTGGASGTTGSFEFNDSTLDSNTGVTGGAFGGTSATFNRSSITNNIASGAGTGGVSSGAGSIRVVDSYVANNRGTAASSTGGGIQGANVTVINTTVDRNSTAGSGVAASPAAGGVSGKNVTIQQSTISQNNGAQPGGGIRAFALTMSGSIVSGNSPSNGDLRTRELAITGPGSTSAGNNLIGLNDPGQTGFNSAGDITYTDVNSKTDATKAINPLLGNAQANGGPVFTRALGAGSPAINNGSFTPASKFDARGFPRVGRSDIGAFEVQTGNSVGLTAGDDQTAQTNQSFPTSLAVLVTDPNGNTVPDVIVRFQAPTTPNPTASATFFGQGPVTGVVTDFFGRASVPVAANATVGDYIVTANTGNGPVGAAFNLRNTGFGISPPPVGSAIQIFSGSNQSATANAQFGQNLVVQILDPQGNGFNNTPVTFTAPSIPNQPSLTFANGLTTITVTTSTLSITNPSTGVTSQIAGLVSVPVNANTVASTTPYLVEASGPSVGAVNFSLTNVPASASKVSVISGGGQATLTNTAFNNPLLAQVTDIFGNPVLANVSVSFASRASGGPGALFNNSPFTTVTTDANGVASAIPAANATGGNYFVDATVAGGTEVGSFPLSNIFVPPPPPPPPPPPNVTPIITDVTNQTVANGSSNTYSFGVADSETSPNNLNVTAMSSNMALIPSLVVGGTGINRTVTVNAAGGGASGTATVTLTVIDESGGTSTDTFDVTVSSTTTPPPPPTTPSNSPPVISDIVDQTITAGQSTSTPFVVIDGETAAAALVVTATAANATLIPAVTVTGTGSNRTVSVFTASGQSGTTTVTVTVTDADNNSTTDTFLVTVPQPTTPPPPPATPTVPLVGNPQFAVGSGANGSQVVRYFNPDQTERFLVSAFPGVTGGVRTATGDFNGDGVADVVIGTGPGSASQVQVLNGLNGTVLFALQPFEAAFTGGVYVAAGDLNGDGLADLVITPDEGGGPRARILSGNGFGTIADFFVIDDANFRGGARAALGDVNGDGRSDLITSAGFGGGPRIAGYDGRSLSSTPQKLFADFFLFEQTLRNGAFITVGDVNGDGFADVVGGGGPGGGPRVFALSGQNLLSNSYTPLANFFTGDTNDRGGVRVIVKNLDGDNRADIVVGSGEGSGSRVVGYLGAGIGSSGTPLAAFNLDTFPGFSGGVFVG